MTDHSGWTRRAPPAPRDFAGGGAALYPLILGEGKRLFGATSDKKRWRLADSRAVGDGIVILVYRRDGR